MTKTSVLYLYCSHLKQTQEVILTVCEIPMGLHKFCEFTIANNSDETSAVSIWRSMKYKYSENPSLRKTLQKNLYSEVR